MKHATFFFFCFLFSSSMILAQDGIPPEIMKIYKEIKELEAELKDAENKRADDEILRGIKIQLDEKKKILVLKIEADRQLFKGSAMEYLTKKHHEIVEEYGKLASIEVFNEIYGVDKEGDNKKYFEFSGYARKKTSVFKDYEYLLIGDPSVVTYDIKPGNGFWGGRNHLRFASTALREHDSLLYNGLIWVKESEVHESAKYDYWSVKMKMSGRAF